MPQLTGQRRARAVEDIASRTPDVHERLALIEHYMADRLPAPVPAMERLPLSYYEDGIRSVEALLGRRTVIATHHWQGNPSYTYQDIVRDMLRHGESPAGKTDMMTTMKPAMWSPLTTQLWALMRSEAYEDWLRAWELMRDHTPDHITTFDALETRKGW